MALRRFFAETFAPVIDLVYPPRCPACGEGLAAQDGLCVACWSTLAIPSEPACVSCQRPFGSQGPDRGAVCAPCLASPPRHDGIAAGTLYTEVSRKLVLAFKHGRRLAMAPMLARFMVARLPDLDDPLIVPVPLHRWRLWVRGFNQAAVLGQEIEKLGRGRLLVDVLRRRKRTPPLGGLGAKARRRMLSGSIEVRQSARAQIRGRNVILVDDVLTSGATSEACVAQLKRAGADKVVVCCFARVLDEAIEHADSMPRIETPEAFETPGAT